MNFWNFLIFLVFCFFAICGLVVCFLVIFDMLHICRLKDVVDVFLEISGDLCLKILFKFKPDLAQEIKDVMERGYVE